MEKMEKMERKEISCGIVALHPCKKTCYYKVLLIRQKSGNHWTLTKGHMEAGETPLQTAKRELLEETNLEANKFLLNERVFSNNYIFEKKTKKDGQLVRIDKTNNFFVAVVDDISGLRVQESEVSEYAWLPLGPEAEAKVTYDTDKAVLQSIHLELLESKPIKESSL